MQNVLLCHSYFLRFDPKQWRAQQPYPPYATLSAAAQLRAHGHRVSLFDPMFAQSPTEIEPFLSNAKPSVLVVYDDGFNYLTKMCLTNMRDAAIEMMKRARAEGITTIISSSDSTDHSLLYLQNGADYVIVGEGEQTLCELLLHLNGDQGAETQVPGLRFLREGSVHSTPPRANLRELDALHMPAWDLLDLRPYREAWMSSTGYFSLNVGTTRGCPFKCNWCAKPIYGNRYNSRSPENVVAELRFLKQHAGFDHIWFSDDIFGLKPGWVAQFADLLHAEGLTFRFKIQSRADLLLQEDQIAHLARAGAEEIWIGAESGSQKILDAMDKGTTIEQIETSTRLMKKHGIRPCFFLQFGYPGEEWDDIRLTLDLVDRLAPADIGVSVSYPLPGTPFYEKVKTQMTQKQNWTDSDELLVMFEGTYPASFYRVLQRYVHHRFRYRQALASLRQMDVRRGWQATYRSAQLGWSYLQLKRHVRQSL